jgi:hypothetical protein
MQQLIILLFILIVIPFAFVKIRNGRLLRTVTRPCRGTKAERRLVVRLLKSGIPPHHIFHDLYVKRQNGTFSQIDVVAITTVGLVVFEVKDYSGWLFGKGYQEQWTQVLAYGRRKYRFYNPVLQNQGHIKALRKAIGLSEYVPIYSIIVFYGNCVLRDISIIPDRTFVIKPSKLSKLMRLIIANNFPQSYICEDGIVDILQTAVANGADKAIRRQHIKNVRNRRKRSFTHYFVKQILRL